MIKLARPSALAAALAVLLVAAVGLSLTHHATRLVLPERPAVRAALQDPNVRAAIRSGWDDVNVSPVDTQIERVSFYDGGRVLAEVAVDRAGRDNQGVDFTRARVPYGDWIAYQPAVLAGLAVLFCLMACVVPLRRVRNLDAVAALSMLGSVILLQRRYVDASVLSALPGLVYLMLRCGMVALGRGAPSPPAVPLYAYLSRHASPHERVRTLRIVLLAVALCIAMVAISSPDAVDVVVAVMEGATKMIHGLLPYGHMPGDVVHGDTYPIFSYAAYTPLAWLSPVFSTWDSVDLALGATVVAALAPAVVLWRSGRGRASDPDRLASEEQGLRLALMWLSFPTLMITVSTGTTDVVLAMLLLFAVILWRRPAASMAVLACAGWFKLAPFALVPIWLAPLRGRRLLAALAALGGVSAVALGLLVGIGGSGGPAAMVHALAYQFSRGGRQSLWAVLGVSSVQPIAQAGVLALITAAVVRLRRDGELAADRRRIAALSACVMLGLELSADYWAFLYVVWTAPLIVISAMSPEPRPELAREPRGELPAAQWVPVPVR